MAAGGEDMNMDVDFLDAIVMNENRCQAEGFEEGKADGRRKGYMEGFQLGCQKGAEIASEVGFYQGVIESLSKRQNSQQFSERLLQTKAALSDMIEAFPLRDPRNPQLHEQMEAIRAKFKQLTSLLGIKLQYITTGGVPQGDSF